MNGEAQLRRIQIRECIRSLESYYLRGDYRSVEWICGTVAELCETEEAEFEQEKIQREKQRQQKADRLAAQNNGLLPQETYVPNAY